VRGRIALLATFGLVLVAAADESQSHAGGHASAAGSGHAPRDGLGASAAIDGVGRLFAVHREGNRLVLQRSPDQGRTWGAPRFVTAVPEPAEADSDSRPKIALGPGGEVYVTWTRPLSRPFAGEIRFARSLDGGETFSAPRTVHSDGQEIGHRFDALAVDASGRVIVAWLDKRDREATLARGERYAGAAVYVARSEDRGATFGRERKVADHACECCRIAVRPLADGSVALLWRHVFEPGIRDHALAVLGADGVPGPVRRATLDDWAIDACPHQGPSLAAIDGGLQAVWFTRGPRREGVYTGRLGPEGASRIRQVGGSAAAHADLAAVGRRLAVAWKEFDGERTRLRAIVSEDAGETWSEREIASTGGPSGQPQVLVDGERFLVFWHTREKPLLVEPVPMRATAVIRGGGLATALPVAGAAAAAVELEPFDARTPAALRAAHAGKPFVLAFWSTTCPPCLEELPHWAALARSHPGIPIHLVLVPISGSSEVVEAKRLLRELADSGVRTAVAGDDVLERVFHAVDPAWRGELPAAWFFDSAHRSERRLGRVEASWVESWMQARGATAKRSP
jgi:thiol-disulfide isomerase/thioredoxin